MIDRARATEVALAAATEAAAVVMRIYSEPFAVEYKVKDDPVTAADREANALLCDRLAAAFPGLPVVAEESDPASYAGYEGAEAAWFVDPVDGTRELVARTGEFAVMVGLAERGLAILSVVIAPAWGRTFLGVVGEGAWEVSAEGQRRPIHVSSCGTLSEASLVLSRSRKTEALARAVEVVGPRVAFQHGSSGLKGALVALGTHDIYLQAGPAGMLWDACATDALVCAAGGRCTDVTGRPFDYTSKDLVNRNGLLADNGLLHEAVIEKLLAETRKHA
jgi:3'(2'), 5'-bisphosphate nucleotidase